MSSDPDLDAMIEELARRAAEAEGRAQLRGRGSPEEMETYHYRGALACLLNVQTRTPSVQPAAETVSAPVTPGTEAFASAKKSS